MLSTKLREQIALTVSEANGCGYCVAAHCAIGKSVGLSDVEGREFAIAVRYTEEMLNQLSPAF